MIDKNNLARTALLEALRIRKNLNIGLKESMCPIDASERLGIEVRLIDLPSMEGIYSPGKKSIILLSTMRQHGRRNFTCGHELGHHVFGHGEQFDEIVSEKSLNRKNDPKEFIADCFSGFLLMPKTTVSSGLLDRSYSIASINESQVYSLSSWLGVGYSTLVNHMHFSLKLITKSQYQKLLKANPKQIRQSLYEPSIESNLHIVDQFWLGRAIDCEVGDFIRFPKDTIFEGNRLSEVHRDSQFVICIATNAGIGRASIDEKEWASFIRVSPKPFVGLSQYRHEEEVA